MKNGDICLATDPYQSNEGCKMRFFAVIKRTDEEKSASAFILPESSRCGLFGLSAAQDAQGIIAFSKTLGLDGSFGSPRVVKNAHVVDFAANGDACIGFRNYGRPISSNPGQGAVYSFSLTGFICDTKGGSFDRKRIEQSLSVFSPE